MMAMIHKGREGQLLRIKEVFPTIQGEGPLAGEPCVFVRLEGCNLKCWFCDTDFENGDQRELPALLTRIEQVAPIVQYGKRPVCVITGGEPMMQPIGLLVSTLLGNKWVVQIETAGTLFQELPQSSDLHIVCSPKTPKVHRKLLPRITAWKYLIRKADAYDKSDGLPISQTQGEKHAGDQTPITKDAAPICKPTPYTPVFLQPVDEPDEADTAANVAEAVRRTMRYGHRLCLQQHKIIGMP